VKSTVAEQLDEPTPVRVNARRCPAVREEEFVRATRFFEGIGEYRHRVEVAGLVYVRGQLPDSSVGRLSGAIATPQAAIRVAAVSA